MSAKEKRIQERFDAKEKRKKEVIEGAKQVFAEKTIEKTAMKDIALKAEVGIASVYRYYSTKMALVTEVAKDYLKDDIGSNQWDVSGSGIEQTEQLIDCLHEYLLKKPERLMFFKEYEHYRINIVSDDIDVWNDHVMLNMARIKKAIKEGKDDGSIRVGIDEEEVAYFFFELLIKIIPRQSGIATKSKQNNKNSYMKLYKEMVLKYLSAS